MIRGLSWLRVYVPTNLWSVQSMQTTTCRNDPPCLPSLVGTLTRTFDLAPSGYALHLSNGIMIPLEFEAGYVPPQTYVGSVVTVTGYPVQITGGISGNKVMNGFHVAKVEIPITHTFTQTTQTLPTGTDQYAATVLVGQASELRLATSPSAGCSWWIQSQPSGVSIIESSGTDPSIDCRDPSTGIIVPGAVMPLQSTRLRV